MPAASVPWVPRESDQTQEVYIDVSRLGLRGPKTESDQTTRYIYDRQPPRPFEDQERATQTRRDIDKRQPAVDSTRAGVHQYQRCYRVVGRAHCRVEVRSLTLQPTNQVSVTSYS